MAKKGGLIQAVQHQTIWLMILTCFGFWGVTKIISVKRNYTDLHHRVNQMEMFINELREEK